VALNILVVDDSDVIRSMIFKTLRLAEISLGTMFEAANGKEALDIIDSNWVDLVLADINMPIMDGVEMLRQLRANDQTLEMPVIVVTTEGSSERIAELEAAGVSAYVRKPFTPELIRSVVDSVTSTLSSGEIAAEAVRRSFVEVMERFVMMDVAPAGGDTGEVDPNADLLQASMVFRGAVTGALTLAAPFDLCLEMASNAVGVELDAYAHAEKAADVLGEVLNMTCGCLVLGLEPDRPTDLTPPVVLGMEVAEWERLAALAATTSLAVEGRQALLSCVLRPRR
jgi:two-component system chemotaxis response regulator CheY